MNHPDEELRKAVALFRYGLIADVLRVPLGSREIRRALHEKAQRTYTIPGTRRTRVAVETMRDWLSLYRTGGFEALYPKTRADRGQPRRLPPEVAELLVSLKTEQPALSVNALIGVARERGVAHPGGALGAFGRVHLETPPRRTAPARGARVPLARRPRQPARPVVLPLTTTETFTMLTHPIIDKLDQLKCLGMATALTEQLQSTACDALSFEERLGLLVDRETTVRDDRRMTNRLRRAKLRHPNACIEDVDFRHPRGLDKSLILSFACGRWLREHLNILITGPCGVGKSWLACALAHQACRDGFSALYLRLPRLLHDIAIARGDATYPKLLASFAKLDLLVLDDFGLAKLNADHRRDLLEILEDRYATRSTLVTSQLPIEKWHDLFGDPTFADAILDRLVHNAYKLKLKGGSMRKKKASLTQADH